MVWYPASGLPLVASVGSLVSFFLNEWTWQVFVIFRVPHSLSQLDLLLCFAFFDLIVYGSSSFKYHLEEYWKLCPPAKSVLQLAFPHVSLMNIQRGAQDTHQSQTSITRPSHNQFYLFYKSSSASLSSLKFYFEVLKFIHDSSNKSPLFHPMSYKIYSQK